VLRVDVDGGVARLLETTVDGSGPISAAAIVPLDEGASDTIRVARLAHALWAGGFTTRYCVVAMPRVDLQVRTVTSDEPVASDDGMEILPTGTADESGRERLLVVEPCRAVMAARRGMLVAAGLRVIGVESPMRALARLWGCSTRVPSVPRAIVEVGAEATQIIVVQEGRVALARVSRTGANDLNDAVARRLGVEPACAATTRRVRMAGVDPRPALDSALRAAARPVLEGIVREAALALRAYGETVRGPGPDRIILAGEDAREPGFGDLLEATGKRPVVFDDAFCTLGRLGAPINARLTGDRHLPSVSAWAVAVGLGADAARREAGDTSPGRTAA
jgi:hypothetical protein